MIRYIDMRACYWGQDDELSDRPLRGPFAFADTITGRFVEFDGEQMWHDRKSFREAFEAGPPHIDRARGLSPVERFTSMIQADVPEDELAEKLARQEQNASPLAGQKVEMEFVYYDTQPLSTRVCLCGKPIRGELRIRRVDHDWTEPCCSRECAMHDLRRLRE